MFTKLQLEFIKVSLTAQNSVVPVGDGGACARVFISVLDEIDAQIAAADTASKLAIVQNDKPT